VALQLVLTIIIAHFFFRQRWYFGSMNPKIHPAVQAYGKPSTYHRAMSLPPFARRSAMGAIDRPKNVADDTR
jgi:hypothetical protein